ncbi:hypothetical protein [Criblamydia sequanensis]|uniref:Uncharacterized protein n=1 Tax=Candidatus Criblamydia sequanensis CRIB-18 TaxID=1437425 RepID=A0A090D2B2_9BACT|nr:hypothetical protein [Criblamydia sequanensis]CDR34500.1 hypothetical protein CSEC_1688 [Criblamydia sequanensis CRIB-18]
MVAKSLAIRKLKHELSFLEIELRELYLLLLKKNKALKGNDLEELHKIQTEESSVRENLRARLREAAFLFIELLYFKLSDKAEGKHLNITDLLHLLQNPLLEEDFLGNLEKPIRLFKERIDIMEAWNQELALEKNIPIQ